MAKGKPASKPAMPMGMKADHMMPDMHKQMGKGMPPAKKMPMKGK